MGFSEISWRNASLVNAKIDLNKIQHTHERSQKHRHKSGLEQWSTRSRLLPLCLWLKCSFSLRSQTELTQNYSHFSSLVSLHWTFEMDNETITNMTLHGSTLYNATNISILLTMSRDEYLLTLLGPRKQENEVISYINLYLCVGQCGVFQMIIKIKL